MSAEIVHLKDRRGDPPKQLLYEVEIYDRATYITDPNHDEVDHAHAAAAMLEATYRVYRDTDDCTMLIMIGNTRTDSVRRDETLTAAQKRWLADRLDDLYQQVTGEPRKRSFFGRRK